MPFELIIPQSNPLDPSGRVSREWQQFFINLGTAIAAAGPVSNSSTLTANQLVVGDGTAVIKALAAGTNATVLTMVTGVPAWTAPAYPAASGADTQVQFNNAGAFSGSASFTYNVTTNALALGAVQIGLFAATPIAQPTTAGAAATFVVGAGTAVNDASTFDGYTLKQVVKALRNLGALA